MVKKSARSVKGKITKSAKSKITKKPAGVKVEANFVNELRLAAKASAVRRMKK